MTPKRCSFYGATIQYRYRVIPRFALDMSVDHKSVSYFSRRLFKLRSRRFLVIIGNHKTGNRFILQNIASKLDDPITFKSILLSTKIFIELKTDTVSTFVAAAYLMLRQDAENSYMRRFLQYSSVSSSFMPNFATRSAMFQLYKMGFTMVKLSKNHTMRDLEWNHIPLHIFRPRQQFGQCSVPVVPHTIFIIGILRSETVLKICTTSPSRMVLFWTRYFLTPLSYTVSKFL